MPDNMIQFIGTIREVKAKALMSLDKSYRIIIDTEEKSLLEAGGWPADETVSVTIERNVK